MFGALWTGLIGMVRAFGRLTGNELDVVISEHTIELKMVDPSNSVERGYQWDDSHFTEGNLHLEGIANPIKPKRDEMDSDTDIITSDRYKTFMKNSLMTDIIAEGADKTGLTLFHVIVILSVVQLSMTGAIIYFIVY